MRKELKKSSQRTPIFRWFSMDWRRKTTLEDLEIGSEPSNFASRRKKKTKSFKFCAKWPNVLIYCITMTWCLKLAQTYLWRKTKVFSIRSWLRWGNMWLVAVESDSIARQSSLLLRKIPLLIQSFSREEGKASENLYWKRWRYLQLKIIFVELSYTAYFFFLFLFKSIS